MTSTIAEDSSPAATATATAGEFDGSSPIAFHIPIKSLPPVPATEVVQPAVISTVTTATAAIATATAVAVGVAPASTASAAVSSGKPTFPSRPGFRNGRVALTEKKLALDRHHATIAELAAFHAQLAKGKTAISGDKGKLAEAHLPLIAKLVQDADVAITQLVSKVMPHLCPAGLAVPTTVTPAASSSTSASSTASLPTDDNSATNEPALTEDMVRNAIEQVATYTAYGVPAQLVSELCSGREATPNLSLCRWEVNEPARMLSTDIASSVLKRRENRLKLSVTASESFRNMTAEERTMVLDAGGSGPQRRGGGKRKRDEDQSTAVEAITTKAATVLPEDILATSAPAVMAGGITSSTASASSSTSTAAAATTAAMATSSSNQPSTPNKHMTPERPTKSAKRAKTSASPPKPAAAQSRGLLNFFTRKDKPTASSLAKPTAAATTSTTPSVTDLSNNANNTNGNSSNNTATTTGVSTTTATESSPETQQNDATMVESTGSTESTESAAQPIPPPVEEYAFYRSFFKPFFVKSAAILAPENAFNTQTSHSDIYDTITTGQTDSAGSSKEESVGYIRSKASAGRHHLRRWMASSASSSVHLESPYHGTAYPRRNKFLQFEENQRPPWHAPWPTSSVLVNGRRPFVKDTILAIDYDVDSDLEWNAEDLDGDETMSATAGPEDDDEDEYDDDEEDDDGGLGGSDIEGVGLDGPSEGAEGGNAWLVRDDGTADADDEADNDDSNIALPAVRARRNRLLASIVPIVIGPVFDDALAATITQLADLDIQPFGVQATAYVPIDPFADLAPQVDDEAVQFTSSSGMSWAALASTAPDSSSALADTQSSNHQHQSTSRREFTHDEMIRFVRAVEGRQASIQKTVESLKELFPTFPKVAIEAKLREIARRERPGPSQPVQWRIVDETAAKLGRMSNASTTSQQLISPIIIPAQ